MISQFRRSKSGRQGISARRHPRQPHPAIVFACQPLETRRLLADIGGIVFHDLNVNGVKDLGEGLQQGFNVYVDLNRNGVRDEGEPFDTSNGFGQWRISGLAPGRYAVRVEQRPGFTRFPSTPAAGFHAVNLAEDSIVDNLDFGTVRYASVSGQVFFDLNGNGIRDGADSGRQGVTVYVDANRNGQLDADELRTTTDAEGRYRIDFLYPGFNAIRMVVPEGMQPSPQVQRAGHFPSGHHASEVNFGLTNVGNIIGHVFSDLDGDGVQSPLEPDKAGHVVYLDLNNNGQFDAGVDVATRTDAAGNYYFTGLRPGPYLVRTDIPAATAVTLPRDGSYAVNLQASQTISGRDFGLAPFGRVRGYVFSDDNSDGVHDVGEYLLAGRRVFIDYPDETGRPNGRWDPGEPSVFTNQHGEFLFPALPAGRYAIDVEVPAGQIQTAPPNGRHIVDVRAGELITDLEFGLALAGEIRGRVFNDSNGNGVFDPGERGIAGRRVFIDANDDGIFNPGEISAVTGAAGVYTLPNLRDGTYNIRTVPIPGTDVTTPAGEVHVVTLRGGQFVNNRNFGFAMRGELRGSVFNDENANGVRGPADTPRPGVVVYADLDNNGVLDVGEPSAITDAQGFYSLTNLRAGPTTLRIQTPAGFAISVPEAGFYTPIVLGGERRNGFVFGLYETASIGGVVFNDINENGVQDGGELALAGQTVYLDLNNNGVRDFGEPIDLTAVDGSYLFSGLRPGAYTVRITVPTNGKVTAPPSGSHPFLIVTSGDAITNAHFGLVLPGTITGTVFNDLDADGTQGVGEGGLGGRTVFLDTNGNNVLDPDELSVVTNLAGTYTFSNLPPGNYRVKLVLQPGDTVTVPVGNLYNLALTSNATLTDNDFGLALPAGISGVVYADADGDGVQDPGEDPIEGITVFLDLNGNGVRDGGEDMVTTDATGAYAFTGLTPGDYDVRIEAPAGAVITEPAGEFYDDETVVSGQQLVNRDFGIASGISGAVYDDNDTDGTLSVGDVPLAGVRIFADLDGNGVFDAGTDPSVLTDAVGLYFLPLAGGTYDIRIELPAGGVPIAPASDLRAGVVIPVNGGVTGVNWFIDVP